MIRRYEALLRLKDHLLSRTNLKQINSSLTYHERALKILFGRIQEEFYQDEIVKAQKGEIPIGKHIAFINEAKWGLLTIKSRLRFNPNLPEEQRFPVLLHPNSRGALLLARHVHERMLKHAGGINHTHAKLNLIAFIPKARTLVKKILSDCIVCKKKFSRPMKQQMAPLPNVRVQRLESRTPVFDTTMLDCAGPFFVVSGRRKIKRWILLLTCAQFRAIHLEVISGLDTTSFLRGLNRSWQGDQDQALSSVIRDQFQRIDSELQVFWQSDDFKRVQDGFPEIRWRFNPPAAPHHGGAFERLVRSVKESH